MNPSLEDRHYGCLLGLACGDAVGTTVEFKSRGTFEPLTDMVGGGPFHLKPGQWTDDTSMALCLAESLVECRGFDPQDQMERYLRWRDEGHWSPTGTCFDIGNTVGAALRKFESTGNPYSGPADRMSAGNGCIMQLAPIPMYLGNNRISELSDWCRNSARTTHGAVECLEATDLFGHFDQKTYFRLSTCPLPNRKSCCITMYDHITAYCIERTWAPKLWEQ